MGKSLSAYLAFGGLLVAPEWPCEEEFFDSPWPWDKEGHWWSGDEEDWLQHLYGASKDMGYFQRKELPPIEIDHVSWGDEMIPVIRLRDPKPIKGFDDGFLPLDLTNTYNLERQGRWREVLKDFENRSGLQLDDVGWFVGYKYW